MPCVFLLVECLIILPFSLGQTNPRGLQSYELRQTDVTYIPAFGKLGFVHVVIDAYSGFIWASAQSGEKLTYVEKHLLECFDIRGKPKAIKIDNGPANAFHSFQPFWALWDINHYPGIPYTPQGQGMVERAPAILKLVLAKQKGEMGV